MFQFLTFTIHVPTAWGQVAKIWSSAPDVMTLSLITGLAQDPQTLAETSLQSLVVTLSPPRHPELSFIFSFYI